ncbi:MAG: UDP-3-O-(3-hydroxymyristoyl)glucosamine N-acyltransferase [Lentisphaerae bacterium]|nr:UDP-3-O-(3-hydroxymyristoyl)glucosamine N-acyltransferase [Lentisphaerota bacterium]
MAQTVAQLAAWLKGSVEGDATEEIAALSALDDARRGDVSFLSNPRYEQLMAHTQASAVLVGADWQGVWSCRALIRVDNPNKAFATLAALFCPKPVTRQPGIHPTAVLGEGVSIGRDVFIGPYVVIEDQARIGDRTRIDAQCWIGAHARIGCDGLIYPQVTVREGCLIGDRVILHSGVRIGSDGYGYSVEQDAGGSVRVEKIPQMGIVELGDDVEIGANTTIDRARFGRTRIGHAVKIDNLVQIGHNVQVGDTTGIVAQTGVAGSVKIGSGVMIWAQAGIAGHITVGDRAQIGPQSGVSKDVPPGEFVIGAPAQSKRAFVATLAMPRQIERLKAQVDDLGARLAVIAQAKKVGE